jgi:glycerol-3-phosphate dehydrogenase (NAD(P)+)
MTASGPTLPVAVLGAGAWGTAIAVAAARRGAPVTLWSHRAEHAAAIAQERCNRSHLPGADLPTGLRIEADLERTLADTAGGLLLLAMPMAGLRGLLDRLRDRPDIGAALWLCKGLEAGSGRLGHEIAAEVLAGAPWPCGVLSGPSFAQEVARGQPTALVAASASPLARDLAVRALHGPELRVYTSEDVTGVEVGGAVKNVVAVAVGALDGIGGGLNARAALVTRGLAEVTRLGVALGGRVETFMGLSGLGDLVLTTTGDLSRNRRVGLLLAQGLPLSDVLSRLGHVAEGVHSAPVVLDRARRLGVEMPIVEAVVALLEGRLTVPQAVRQLMERSARAEAPSLQPPPA